MRNVERRNPYLDTLLEEIDRDRDVLWQEEDQDKREMQAHNLLDKMRQAIHQLYSLWRGDTKGV